MTGQTGAVTAVRTVWRTEVSRRSALRLAGVGGAFLASPLTGADLPENRWLPHMKAPAAGVGRVSVPLGLL